MVHQKVTWDEMIPPLEIHHFSWLLELQINLTQEPGQKCYLVVYLMLIMIIRIIIYIFAIICTEKFKLFFEWKVICWRWSGQFLSWSFCRKHLEVGNNSLPNPSPTIPCPTHQQVAGACVHVLVHEVQDSEPESSEGWQREQRREVLQEDLRRHRQGCGGSSQQHSRNDSHTYWMECRQWKIKAGFLQVGLIYWEWCSVLLPTAGLLHLWQQRAGSHPGLLHPTHICWADVLQQLRQQREQHLQL